jgi:hypothetical protein
MTAFLAPITKQATVTVDGIQLLMRVSGGPQPVDSDGVEWICTKLEGWSGRARPRTARTPKPFGIGTYRSRSQIDAKVIAVEFVATAPDPGTIRLVEEKVDAWCSDGGRLYEFKVSDPPLEPKIALVELDDQILSAPRTLTSIRVSAQFAAPDPRKWSATWMDRTTGLPTPAIDGLEYSGDVDFSGAGIDYGVPPIPAIAQVANYGTAPVGPFISVTGPIPQPRVTDLVSGWSMVYMGTLTEADTLTINCDEFPQRDQPGHSALLNGVTNVWSKVVRNGDWPTVDPQAIATYQLVAPTLSAAILVVSLRSAWF